MCFVSTSSCDKRILYKFIFDSIKLTAEIYLTVPHEFRFDRSSQIDAHTLMHIAQAHNHNNS